MSRWVIFISLFLCIYGALHLYLLIKVRRAYYLESWAYILIAVILLFMLLLPIQARVLETQNHPILALAMTWVGYLWMGCLFIWFWLALAGDAYHLAITLMQRLFNTDWTHLLLSRRQSLALTVLAACGLMLYGAYAAQQVRSEHLTLTSEKIPAASGRIRIVQISDVHLGVMLLPGKIDKIVAAVQAAQPDILVSTGDLVDGRLLNADKVSQQLDALPSRLGKFAVTGNHEAYAGLPFAQTFTQSAGFSMLHNRVQSVDETITIVGVDDPATGQFHDVDEAALLEGIPTGRFAILLKHQPQVSPNSQGRFDLQLSGHTHQGQIFPFGFLIRRIYPLFSGLYDINPHGYVYVSRGTGTWGPPVRLGAPPEVTIIDLLPRQSVPHSGEVPKPKKVVHP